MRLPIHRCFHKVVPVKQFGPRTPHVPVMLNELLEYLRPKGGETILDMTFGAGGHTKHILAAAPNVNLVVLDRDPTAYEYAKELQSQYKNILPLLGRFSELPTLLKDVGIHQKHFDGVIMDLGASSMQFDTAERGFAISKNGPLDMRMDQDRYPNQITAANVLNCASEKELYQIFKIYGEEKRSKAIARAVVQRRMTLNRFETTKDLADLVEECFDGQHKLDKIQRPTHAATKVFQALRIFVNDELNELNYAMILADKYLKIGGRLVTLTFHSLEDTIVKRHLTGHIVNDTANPIPLKYCSYQFSDDAAHENSVVKTNWEPLNKHVLTPKFEEIELNPRSRSAKLRAAVKIS